MVVAAVAIVVLLKLFFRFKALRVFLTGVGFGPAGEDSKTRPQIATGLCPAEAASCMASECAEASDCVMHVSSWQV